MNSRAVICGYYGQGNSGDEALLLSLLQMLPSQVTPVVLSANPGQTSDLLQVESCPNRSLGSLLKTLRQSDVFLWGGGSLIQDVTSFASPLYYNGLMAMAQQLGVKTMAWAQGIGPIKSPINRLITKKVLQNCQAVSVRDGASAKLVSDWGIPVIIAPDPVWALESLPVGSICSLPAPRVALCWRPHPLLTPARLDHLIQAVIAFQKATEAFILLVPFQPAQDLPLARYVSSQLQVPHEIICLEDPRELKGLFRGVEMTIGMRLHSLIMAAAESNRTFALSYDPKVTQLMKELNLPGWELAQLPDDPKLISTIWLKEYVEGDPLSGDQILSLVDRAHIHQDVLTKVFSQIS